jgi:hypothetical protein
LKNFCGLRDRQSPTLHATEDQIYPSDKLPEAGVTTYLGDLMFPRIQVFHFMPPHPVHKGRPGQVARSLASLTTRLNQTSSVVRNTAGSTSSAFASFWMVRIVALRSARSMDEM